MNCQYAQRAEIAYRVDPETGEHTRVEGPMLCAWAMDKAPEQLINVPRWLQRNALAGHLLKYPDDCMGCPCFTRSST